MTERPASTGAASMIGKAILIIVIIVVVAYALRDNVQHPASPPRAQLNATEALTKGREVFDSWHNPKERWMVQLPAVSNIISDLERVPASDPLHETAAKAADVLRPIRDALATEAAREAKAKKAREEEDERQWRRDVIAVRALRSSMNNPNSFQIEQAIRMKDGTLCLTFRATNAFNALIVGRAVIDAKRFVTSDDRDRFNAAWNKLCGGKTGTDIKHIRLAL